MTDRPILFSAPTVENFWSKVSRSGVDCCWEWTGPLNAKGYGRFHANGQSHAQIARDLSLSVATISRVRNAREDYGR